MSKKMFYIIFCYTWMIVFSGCHSKEATPEEDVAPEEVRTPVTVTTVSNETLSDFVDLNATSTFLQSNVVKSNVNGYIESVYTKMGQFASSGQTLFTLKTKEAASLGNTINKLDPSFHFTGLVHVVAAQSGYVTQLLHQVGDYVQDGEQLAAISNTQSFGFLLNVPYELRRYVPLNHTVEVALPDSTHLPGKVVALMPVIDSVSQTQGVLVQVPHQISIPANLIAKVRILKGEKNNVPTLPKQAVLTDESQTNFWVMKMIDSVTAVKIPVQKGMETASRVEIISPRFAPGDQILLTGNYGLPDTAKVKMVKEQE